MRLLISLEAIHETEYLDHRLLATLLAAIALAIGRAICRAMTLLQLTHLQRP